MKKLITNYTFDASAKQVTFTDYATISLEQVLLITNVTDNVIIYNFASTGGTVATNVLTLDYNTTSMDDTDDLQIFYDDPNYDLPLKREDSASASGDFGFPLLAIRQAADTTSTDADGDYTLLKLDEEGRLKTSSKTASFAVCSGILTTTAANASSLVGDVATAAGYLSVNVSRASNVVLHVKNSGGTNQTAGNFTFEASIDSTNGTDGTWFAIQVVRSNANTIELTTGTLTLNAGVGLGYSYESSVNAYNWFRIRVGTNVTTGAADTWTIIRGSYATEPIPAMQSHSVTLTSTTIGGSATVGGQTLFRDVALSNTDVTVKASAGRVYSWYFKNPHATDTAWVHFYNALIANVTVGSTVPVWSVEVPAGGTNEFEFTVPMTFATGITIAATTSPVHTVSTAPTTALQAFVGYI